MKGDLTRRTALIAPLALAACASGPKGFLVPVASTPPSAKQVDMLVVTTRKPSPEPGVLFGGERDQGYSTTEIVVSVPANRKIGEVQWPKNDEKAADPAKDFTTVSVTPSDDDNTRAWFTRVAGDKARLLMFVHGYNTRYETAVYRLAQISVDSGAEAAPLLFTWPSRGRLFDYVYDHDSANYSRNAFEQILTRAFESEAVKDITVLAHSMGTFLTMEALRQTAIRRGGLPPKLRNVILASPDIDVMVFGQQIADFGKPRPHMTIFVSSDDKALAVSRLISGKMNRLGAIDPSKEPYRSKIEEAGDITVIDLSAYKSGDSLNHDKFAESPEIVQLIGQRLVNGQTMTGAGH